VLAGWKKLDIQSSSDYRPIGKSGQPLKILLDG